MDRHLLLLFDWHLLPEMQLRQVQYCNISKQLLLNLKALKLKLTCISIRFVTVIYYDKFNVTSSQKLAHMDEKPLTLYHIVSYDFLHSYFDYLTISSDHGLHTYCGDRTGQTVVITGDAALITFHSDSSIQDRGFVLFFTAFTPVGKCYHITHVSH